MQTNVEPETAGSTVTGQQRELLETMADATTLDEMSMAMFEARIWLSDHPEDEQVRSAMMELVEDERSALGAA